MEESVQIFISYSHKDLAKVENLLNWLFEEGVDRENVFFDNKSLRGADNYRKKISNAIDLCKVVILFISKSSIESNWVKDEVGFAHDNGKIIIPVFLEKVDLPNDLKLILTNFHAIFLYKGNKKKNYHSILESLSNLKLPITVTPNDFKITSSSDSPFFKKIFKWSNLIFILVFIIALLFVLNYIKDNTAIPKKITEETFTEPIISQVHPLPIKSKEIEILGETNSHEQPFTLYYSFLRKVGMNKFEINEGGTIFSGDSLQIKLRTSSGCYIYILNLDAKSNLSVMYPQGNRSNFFKSETLHILPGPDEYYKADDNTGKEILFFIASGEPINYINEIINYYSSQPSKTRKELNMYSMIKERSISKIVKDADDKKQVGDIILNDDQIRKYLTGEGVLFKEIQIKHIDKSNL